VGTCTDCSLVLPIGLHEPAPHGPLPGLDTAGTVTRLASLRDESCHRGVASSAAIYGSAKEAGSGNRQIFQRFLSILRGRPYRLQDYQIPADVHSLCAP
jgi:hypothetical protein